MAPVFAHFLFDLSIKLPPIECSCLKLWLRENFRSRETQKIKGVKITRKVKTVNRKCCIKKTHTFTIIATNFVQEQLNTHTYMNTQNTCVGICLHKDTQICIQFRWHPYCREFCRQKWDIKIFWQIDLTSRIFEQQIWFKNQTGSLFMVKALFPTQFLLDTTSDTIFFFEFMVLSIGM